MSITVTTYGSVPRRSVARVEQIVPDAGRAVERRCGRLPVVRLVLTLDRHFGDLAVEAEAPFAPELPRHVRADWLRDARGQHRGKFGCTLLERSGGVLIALNVDQPDNELPVTLAHELVHARQLSGRSAREAHIRHIRHELGVEPLPERDARAYTQRMARNEAEAHRLEHQLARRITY